MQGAQEHGPDESRPTRLAGGLEMNARELMVRGVAIVAVASFAMAPVSASAQNTYKHRQETKNQWRNLAIGSGALGLLGLLNHDSTLAFVGTAGALYSANRYEQDRKSQNNMRHARYTMFR